MKKIEIQNLDFMATPEPGVDGKLLARNDRK